MTGTHLTFESNEGVELAIAGYRGCAPDELLRCLQHVRDWIVLQPSLSILKMTLAAGVSYRPDAMRELASVLRLRKPHVKASAVVGSGHLTLLIRVIDHFSGRAVQAFEHADDVRRWLREQAGRAVQE